jgi:hypothetical protein
MSIFPWKPTHEVRLDENLGHATADGTTGSGYLVQRDGVALIQDNGVRSSFEIDLQKVPLESLD